MTRDEFAAHQGSAFRVALEGGRAVDVHLALVSDLRRMPGQEGFSLLFHGPAEPALAQGTFPMSHPQMGEMDLFVVPISRDECEAVYEAVFSRLV